MDRDTVVKSAERFVRQGRLDRAIAEYVRLVQDQPSDWTAVNTLGDLYAQAGDADLARAQYLRVADHAFDAGFIPKAAALYRKALKVQGTDEHALLRLGDIAGRQGLGAEARQYLRQVESQRRARGDERGAGECVLRLGLLDDADADARLAAARAAEMLGQPGQAAALLQGAAEVLVHEGRADEARAALADAARLAPDDMRLRGKIVREALAVREFDRAREFLTLDSAGDDPDLLLALGRLELEAAGVPEACAAFTRFVAVAPARDGELLEMACELARSGSLDAGYACVEIVADAALLGSDWSRAVAALRRFTEEHPHGPALQKLMTVADEAGFSDIRCEAQMRLVEWQLAAGYLQEALAAAEDLVAGDRASDTYRALLRRVRAAQGLDDESVGLPVRRDGDEVAAVFDSLDLLEVGDLLDVGDLLETNAYESTPSGAPPEAETVDLERLAAALQWSQEVLEDQALEEEVIEVDLSEALGELGTDASPSGVISTTAGAERAGPLESVFEDLRRRATRDEQFVSAEREYARGVAAVEAGDLEQGVTALTVAARAPLLRFSAAARIADVCVTRGDWASAVEWFERAAAAPAPDADATCHMLYGLADALERTGESARALAVLIELESVAGAYRDVAGRIARLREQTQGSPPR